MGKGTEKLRERQRWGKTEMDPRDGDKCTNEEGQAEGKDQREAEPGIELEDEELGGRQGQEQSANTDGVHCAWRCAWQQEEAEDQDLQTKSEMLRSGKRHCHRETQREGGSEIPRKGMKKML